MTALRYVVGRSGIQGRGLFARQSFAPGEVVVEYAGQRITKAESQRRQAPRKQVFIIEFNARYDLDGNVPGNPARFANHSCAPNCAAVVERGRIRLRTLRAIAAGEELTFDYAYRLGTFLGHPCRCGAASCVGYIVAQPDRWKVRRLLHRSGRSLLKNPINNLPEVRV